MSCFHAYQRKRFTFDGYRDQLADLESKMKEYPSESGMELK